MKQSKIIKCSGERVPFSEEKYRKSLRRSGASDKVIDKILEKIKPELSRCISTKKLYERTHELLKAEKHPAVAGRYNLKKALLRLGPSGYSFEKYISALFKDRGFAVETGVMREGFCVSHEVDVIAVKNETRIMAECKFKNLERGKTSVKTLLYVKARFDDLQEKCEKDTSCGPKFNQCYVITNAKFTSQAIQYSQCRNIKLLGWSYPVGSGLEKEIDECGLHPITCLSSLTHKVATKLLRDGLILCRDLKNNIGLLKKHHVKEKRIEAILQESEAVYACKKM